MTNAEQSLWSQVYSSVIGEAFHLRPSTGRKVAAEEADHAVVALRERIARRAVVDPIAALVERCVEDEG